MKKLLVLLTIVLFSCSEPNTTVLETTYRIDEYGKFKVVEVDSCEYVFYTGTSRAGLAHKGNCKYCKNR